MIEKIFSDQGRKCAVMGTIDHHLGNIVFPTELTTPGPLELQSRVREFVDAGAEVLSMEVSSHALDQNRVDSVQWNTAVFTNLTQDHLDYHGTMGKYFQAKEKLFRERLFESPKAVVWAVINTDDPWGRRIRLPERVGLLTYGIQEGDLRASIKNMDFSGTEVEIFANGKSFPIKLQVIGKHNVLNALAALGASLTAMIPFERALRSLSEYLSVPGRLERVSGPEEKYFFVDYAHTPDALENVLQTLRSVSDAFKAEGSLERKKNKIHLVFGCGGDRDTSKRPQMFKVAKKYADFVYITSDNPRTEDPMKIIGDILSASPMERDLNPGWLDACTWVDPDRRSALRKASERAQPGDVILIAGKGHEEYQIVGTERIPFSDRDEIKKLR
jgi:UDP-N-acetylmuramoyl-L-alanyl-D-glutamate--2,6-diaminopimelate ligase